MVLNLFKDISPQSDILYFLFQVPVLHKFTLFRVQLKCDDAQKGKWRGNWRMEWVASTPHTTSEHGVSRITTPDAHTSAASSRLNWRPPADLNGLVRSAERRNLVSERVPSHFKCSLPRLPWRALCGRWNFLWDNGWVYQIGLSPHDFLIYLFTCIWGTNSTL